MDIQKL